MQEARHDKERQYFQVERSTFFVDAVFAITITFLIIEITPPVIPHPSDQLLWEKISEMGFKFLGFIITFGIVGHYWSVHHRIFGYVIKNSSSLIWLNLGFLLTVVTLPFTVALWGEYSADSSLKIPYAIYTTNMVVTGFMNTWVWRYVSNPKRMMLTRQISRARIRLGVYRSLVIPLVFLFSFLIFLMSPIVGYCSLLLIPIILHWGMGGLEKRAERDENIARITPKSTTLIKEELKEQK
ncbi:MAG: TMEM175 family protein [Ginsengibacter sp.]